MSRQALLKLQYLFNLSLIWRRRAKFAAIIIVPLQNRFSSARKASSTGTENTIDAKPGALSLQLPERPCRGCISTRSMKLLKHGSQLLRYNEGESDSGSATEQTLRVSESEEALPLTGDTPEMVHGSELTSIPRPWSWNLSATAISVTSFTVYYG